MNKFEIKELVVENLSKMFAKELSEASLNQLYKASAITINDILRTKRKNYNTKIKDNKAKKVYYLSMEFLMGRSLKNNIHNLGLVDEFKDFIESLGYNIQDLYDQEPDAGLGNGGLGRLAACYLDALASKNYPAMGFSLRYEYGLFKQKILNNWQIELPDVWLPGGEVWLNERNDKIYTVRFNGYVEEQNIDGKIKYEYKDFREIEAVPYDMMVTGADSEAISVLRLWRSRNIKDFNMKSFSEGDYLKAMKEYNEADVITKLLYPADDHYEGKALRIKQQYFLVSASMQNIVSDHIKNYGDLKSFPKYVAIHINDTHPALCIPELMRIFIDEHNLSFNEAFDIVNKTVAYTNHTVLSEALEQWSEELISKILPRIYILIKDINNHFNNQLKVQGVETNKINDLQIIANNQIKMANLSVVASHTVNGVSKLHSDIIKESIFKGFYELNPTKFTNVTNGIAYRRWLNQSNPNLAKLLEEKIGHDYYSDASKLKEILDYIADDEVLMRLEEIKYQNKCEFTKHLYKKSGIIIDPKTRFDVQVKRLHEYKRQLLNALKIIALLIEVENNHNIDITPQTFIFGAKAYPSYFHAKEVIQLITNLASYIQKNPNISEKINVVFLEDYNVTAAEMLIPASEVSEQISLASKEASGTGNMKFMINGAITLGTLDGANVEIHQEVGDDNIFIFGMKASEVSSLYRSGYNAKDYYDNDIVIQRVIDRLNKGFNNISFENISRYLLSNYPVPDPYMCLADFKSYMDVHNKMDKVYKDKRRWNQMSLENIARAGIFSADRSIEEYATKIWNLKKIK